MSIFIFESYSFENGIASFRYSFDNEYFFEEKVRFNFDTKFQYPESILESALFLAFVLIGTSYYKCFPVRKVALNTQIDKWQAGFFNDAYNLGLGQFAYENNLDINNLVEFEDSAKDNRRIFEKYKAEGAICLQSGGKDSLLLASLLAKNKNNFTGLYVSSKPDVKPKLLENLELQDELVVIERTLDLEGLGQASKNGGLNGHVPVTYIIQSLAVIQAILLGKKDILLAVGHEGAEDNVKIISKVVNHQWSKTYGAELAFNDYVSRYISPQIRVGSPIRCYSELYIAELFVKNNWDKFGHIFSSCNKANYGQGHDNSSLGWCGECPKCANSFLLFAPFVKRAELVEVFGGKNLLISPQLNDMYKNMLDSKSKVRPFECIGDSLELARAYHMALHNGYKSLPFEVEKSDFDYKQLYDVQKWAKDYII